MIGLAFAARRRLAALPGVEVLGGHHFGGAAYDPLRLVLDVRGLGLTGFDAERVLRDGFGVAPAMADFAVVVCVIGLGDTAASVDRLVEAVAALAAERPALGRCRLARPALVRWSDRARRPGVYPARGVLRARPSHPAE